MLGHPRRASGPLGDEADEEGAHHVDEQRGQRKGPPLEDREQPHQIPADGPGSAAEAHEQTVGNHEDLHSPRP